MTSSSNVSSNTASSTRFFTRVFADAAPSCSVTNGSHLPSDVALPSACVSITGRFATPTTVTDTVARGDGGPPPPRRRVRRRRHLRAWPGRGGGAASASAQASAAAAAAASDPATAAKRRAAAWPAAGVYRYPRRTQLRRRRWRRLGVVVVARQAAALAASAASAAGFVARGRRRRRPAAGAGERRGDDGVASSRTQELHRPRSRRRGPSSSTAPPRRPPPGRRRDEQLLARPQPWRAVAQARQQRAPRCSVIGEVRLTVRGARVARVRQPRVALAERVRMSPPSRSAVTEMGTAVEPARSFDAAKVAVAPRFTTESRSPRRRAAVGASGISSSAIASSLQALGAPAWCERRLERERHEQVTLAADVVVHHGQVGDPLDRHRGAR